MTLKSGQHVWIDGAAKGDRRLKFSGPDVGTTAADPWRYRGKGHDWQGQKRREEQSDTAERSWAPTRGTAHRTPGDTERPPKGGTPGQREAHYWATHKVASRADQEAAAARAKEARDRQEGESYGKNLKRAFGEFVRDTKRDFEIASNFATVIEAAPKVLSKAGEFLRKFRGSGGGLSAEGQRALDACEKAVGRAEAAVERAAAAVKRGGSGVEALKREAAQTTGQASAALSKFSEESEAVRRVSSVGPARPLSERSGAVKREGVKAGEAWARGIQDAIRAKTPIKSATSKLRGPFGYLARKPK